MTELSAWLSYRIAAILNIGGIAIIPMFALGTYGFYLLLKAFTQPETFAAKRMLGAMDAMKRSLQAGNGLGANRGGNPIVRIVAETLMRATEGAPEKGVRMALRNRLSLLFYRTMRHLAVIRVLAAAAPLLGLLGTVSGMIRTFDAMHRFGFGSSGLLASGIAEALTATQCGLALAILLLMIGHFQEGRIMRIKHEVEFRIAEMLRCLYGKEPSNG